MSEVKRFSLVKPTLQTKYHIDFDWWRNHDQDWRVYLFSCLCADHQAAFRDTQDEVQIDWVDPETAEVHQVDGLQHTLITHCAKQDDFITPHSTLVDAAFRLFLANGNAPMNSIELGERLGRQPPLILRTFSGYQVYKGLRPCPE